MNIIDDVPVKMVIDRSLKKSWLLVKLGGLLLIWLYSAPQKDRT